MSNNSPFHRSLAQPALSRRDFLWQAGGGLGGLALASLLGTDRALASPGKLTGCLHHPPKAKRVVQFFMAGAASHLDLYDYKPELIKRHGQPSDFGEKVEAFQNGLGPWMRPFWDFQPYGRSGKMLSEVSAPLGAVVDDMAVIHNMVGKSGVHSAATLLQSTGFQLPGFPGAGCWVSYALGSENDNLPTFVVLPDHRGFASNGVKNWDAAFLPSQHSGTIIQPGTANPVADLFPGKGAGLLRPGSEPATQALLAELNQAHAATRPGDQRLEARIRSYELAARMQLAAPEALDLLTEPAHVQKLYGLERFVQVWSGNDNGFPRRNWDSHEDVKRDHGPLALGMSRGIAAFIQDLKQRGLFEDTIILWTTEFGRMPSSQGGKGRDHNPFVFTNWLAGGGIKGGTTLGESDQWGFKPLDRANPTQVYDVHATILHQLGIDHTRLSLRNNGIDRRLTDVHGHVLHGLLA